LFRRLRPPVRRAEGLRVDRRPCCQAGGGPLLRRRQPQRRHARPDGGAGGRPMNRAAKAGFSVVLAPAASAVAAAPRPAPAPDGASELRIPSPARTVLKNGLAVLVLERHAIPLVQMRLLVKAGALSDPAGKEGAARLTARALKRGTRTRAAQQFAEEVDF